MKQETETSHKDRTTRAYNAKDAIRELENDLAHNKQFPTYSGTGTDVIRVHTSGIKSPSIIVSKSCAVAWIREHFKQSPTKANKHWVEDAVLYTKLTRNRYSIWLDCDEDRQRTDWSQAKIDAVEAKRNEVFNEEE